MSVKAIDRHEETSLRKASNQEPLGRSEVRIKLHTVGISSSNVHRYHHGRSAPLVLREPMILCHEAAGTVVEVGPNVCHLQPGDRVCIEPGVPDPNARVTQLGMYNLDARVRFWATPPGNGALHTTVVHEAAFTHKLPKEVSFAEGAMVDSLAVGIHATIKARIKPGDLAVVIGSGCTGLVTALAALAAGCAQVIVADRNQARLKTAARSLPAGAIILVNPDSQDLSNTVAEMTGGWGADAVFECSGDESSAVGIFELLCPAGVLVFVGIPSAPIAYDVVAAQVREARVEHVFRHAHAYSRALALIAAGRIDIKPLITNTFRFEDSVEAFDFVAGMPPEVVKAQIQLPQ